MNCAAIEIAKPPSRAKKILQMLLLASGTLGCMQAAQASTRVTLRCLEADSKLTTPALICLTDSTGQVRLPPDGRVLKTPSLTKTFYEGVKHHSSSNWIGPVRKMQGKGNNNDRSYVYEMRPSQPYWQESVNYLVNGTTVIDLPEGRWRLAVDHGIEFIPVTREFSTSGKGTQTVSIELERWIDLAKTGWWSGDVHVHHPTVDPAHREFLLAYAKAADIHVVNVLEMGHHGGTDFAQAGFGPAFRINSGDYWLIAGQEDPRSTFGHIIGLNLQSLVRDLSTYDFYDVTFKGIHQQPGALVGYAHFGWNGCDLPRGFPWYVTTEDLDFIELLQFGLLNGGDYYDYLNLGFRLTAAAGSDIPWGSTLGEVRTYVFTGNKFSPDRWFAGIREGRTFVSNGPSLDLRVDGKLPGTRLAIESGQSVRIKASSICHPAIGILHSLTLVGNEGILATATEFAQSNEMQLELNHPVQQSQWIALRAECKNGAVAHSTPVYLEVNGQPTWSPQRGPAIIARQLSAIEVIKAEFQTKNDGRSKGICARLDGATQFYQTRLRQMMPSPAKTN